MKRKGAILSLKFLVRISHSQKNRSSLILIFYLFVGSGSFGAVKKAVRISDGKEVAIKIIPKRNVKDHLDMVKDEVDVLTSLDHPNVIGFYDSFESR